MKISFIFLAAWTTFAADSVQDRFTPTPYDHQKIEGALGDRMRVNLEGRLLHVDEVGLIEGFQHRPGKQDWIGEHVGKFLDAGSHTWQSTHDERLRTLIDRMARDLIATQLPDGYLGTYTDDKRWTSWDVWVHKYDLIGLLSYYQISGYPPALASARKVGDLLAKTFGDGPGQRDIIRSSTHVGMAATSVLEPMVNLYRATGEQRYLDFCNYILRAWNQPNGPKLIPSLLETGSVYKTANAKAYEMMSDLVGLAEMYRLTGKPEYLKAVQNAWQDISSKRLYLTGTTSSKEHFTDDFELPADDISNVGEGCATVTWLQLNWQLLRLTGESKYADQIERTVYNQLLGAQDPKNGNICYFTPMNGKKNATPGINCCVSSEPRGIALIPQVTAGTLGGGFALLLYTRGKWKAGALTWKAETAYPLNGKVSLTVSAGRGAMPLFLRVPVWTNSFKVSAGGQTYSGQPGTLLKIDGSWKTGDRIEIEMDMATKVVVGTPSYPYSVAIERGPQVLALDDGVNSKLTDIQAAGPRSSDVKLTDASAALPATWLGKQAYSIDGVVAGKPRTLYLVPFADARSYRVWMLKP